MLYISVDPRDGNGAGGSCSKCCCDPIPMRAGEINQLRLDYAAWTLPMSGRGLIPMPEFSVKVNTDGCQSAPFTALFGEQDVVINTETTFTLVPGVSPAAAYTFELEPLSGPDHGEITESPGGGAGWKYMPANSFEGWDHMWVRITDGDGNALLREVIFKIGDPESNGILKPYAYGKTGVIIDPTQVVVDDRYQTLSFPIELAMDSACDTFDRCKRYRVTVKAKAQDCECRTYTHLSCFDVYCANC